MNATLKTVEEFANMTSEEICKIINKNKNSMITGNTVGIDRKIVSVLDEKVKVGMVFRFKKSYEWEDEKPLQVVTRITEEVSVRKLDNLKNWAGYGYNWFKLENFEFVRQMTKKEIKELNIQ